MFLASRLCFFMILTCSWVSWPKNDTERIWNHLKKPVLDPKHVKLVQKFVFWGNSKTVKKSRAMFHRNCEVRSMKCKRGENFRAERGETPKFRRQKPDFCSNVACFGSKTCFLRWFHIRSVSFFGQETQEHVETIKNAVWGSKTIFFLKHALKRVCFPGGEVPWRAFLEGFPASFLARSAAQSIYWFIL